MNTLPLRVIFVAVVVALATISNVLSTVVNKCDEGLVPEVDITGCDQQPCTLHLGSEVGFQMKFRSPKYLENIKPEVIATVSDLHITYPIDQNDACEGITNIQCPIAANEKVEYYFGMNLSTWFPEISLGLKFSILDLDAEGAPAVCFQFDCQTKKD